ncbi:MAG: hypothetical protein H6603_11725 [Flavobacteriales bacterium]|nr:hypothetical protein [Flavobacteriales bacterium]
MRADKSGFTGVGRFTFLFLILIGSKLEAQTLVVSELGQLPNSINETSGLEVGPNNWFWTHNDSGNSAELYCVDTTGTIQRTVSVVGDVNTDWEELAKDDQGNLFIGNFGNNSLNRTDLRIVKIPSIDTCTGTTYVSDTINFTYPDQFSFPPNGNYGNFDMEAFFWYQDSLHLFSKDRSSQSTGYTKHYRLPSIGGNYQAELIDSLYTGSNSYIWAITAADISENGQQVALLNADHIWLISDYTGSDFFNGTVSELALGSFTQKEGICFRNGFIYLTDEKESIFGTGGKLYRLHPSVFVNVDETGNTNLFETVYDANYRLVEIRVSNEQPFDWKLLSTDGKLVRLGSAKRSIDASEFGEQRGMFVIQLSVKGQLKAMLIKL